MPTTATRTTDTHGHPLHYDLTMTLTVAGGAAKLRNVRRASVAHARNNGR